VNRRSGRSHPGRSMSEPATFRGFGFLSLACGATTAVVNVGHSVRRVKVEKHRPE
jgi:hypothetical protein